MVHPTSITTFARCPMSSANQAAAHPVSNGDHRSFERTYGEIDAIYIAGDDARGDCKLLDFSDTGARVLFDSGDGIPDEFTLEVPEMSMQFVAEVMRRNGPIVGVRFTYANRITKS